MSQIGWDLEEKEHDTDEPSVHSVSEINSLIRQVVEGEFPLVWVQGEISNFTAHSSGHFYFSLKDKKSQISAVMFRGFNSRLKFRPETGLEVIIRGKISVYEPRGTYQLYCETMEPVGAGALQKAFEQLKAKLQKEGLFDPAHKKPIPEFPKHVAVVTSPTGAAIRDIINVLSRRNKTVKVTVVPALVQGATAAQSIVEGIKKAQSIKDVDTLIVGRGGGSMEDLWCFNDENVARAIYDCPVPVISAVGHEIDFTISDFVADLRAPTPSAAAELVVKNVEDLVEKVDVLFSKLIQRMENVLAEKRHRVKLLSHRLVDPKKRLEDMAIRCDELLSKLELLMRRRLERQKSRVELMSSKLVSPKHILEKLKTKLQTNKKHLWLAMKNILQHSKDKYEKNNMLLDSLSPLKVVDRGYSIVKKGSQVIKDVKQLKVGEMVNVQFAKGHAEMKVESIKESK